MYILILCNYLYLNMHIKLKKTYSYRCFGLNTIIPLFFGSNLNCHKAILWRRSRTASDVKYIKIRNFKIYLEIGARVLGNKLRITICLSSLFSLLSFLYSKYIFFMSGWVSSKINSKRIDLFKKKVVSPFFIVEILF